MTIDLIRRRAYCLLIGMLLPIVSGGAWADTTGAQLAQRVYERPKGKDSVAASTMTLTEEGRAPRVRRLISYRLEKKPGEASTLIRFSEPADINGTGLLTVDYPDAETGQWIYLPALGRVRRISASRKGGRFVNSEYFYEDLRERKPPQDIHRILGREIFNGIPCDLLESIPADPGNSIYLKRVSWIDPNSLLALRIDFFEKSETQASKRWAVRKMNKIQGYWTVLDSAMTDLANGNHTRLTIEKILYDRKLPASLFTTQALEDEDAEDEYRP